MLLPHRFPRPLRLGLYALATVILLWLCLAPQEELPQPGLSDRWEHSIAWFVLTATGYMLAPNRRRAIPAYALALGVVVEILQGAMALGRHSDPLDFLMDTLGVAAAVALYGLYHRLVRR